MDKLFNEFKRRAEVFKISSEDKEEIVQNSLLYLVKKGITSIPNNYIYTILKTQLLQLKRPIHMKNDQVSDDGYVDAIVQPKQEDNIIVKDIHNSIMKVKSIPIQYRKAIATYLTTNDSFKDISDDTNLPFLRLRSYFYTNKRQIKEKLNI